MSGWMGIFRALDWPQPAAVAEHERAAPPGGSGRRWAGHAGLSDGLVVLPQSGMQKLVRQVVPGDDPNDLGHREESPRLQNKPTGARRGANRACPILRRVWGQM